MKPLSESELQEQVLSILSTGEAEIEMRNTEEMPSTVGKLKALILQDRKAHEENIKNIIKMSDKYTFADGTVFVRQRNQGEIR